MPRVVSVRLRRRGQFYDFDAGDLELSPGDWVIVDTARGQDIGQIVLPPALLPEEDVEMELKPVLRLADEADRQSQERFQEREAEALERARIKVQEAGLPMRLISAEYTYNGRSLTIYFTSDKRVDFRELVKHLAREFRTRIELRQVGARDEACLLGGIGTCGRPLCCATFLHDFLRISVRMAKEQELPLSPMKISGVCGRLLCCLSYEYDQYREIRAHLPSVGEEVTTVRGSGRVVAISVPKEMVTVEIRPGMTIEARMSELTGTVETRCPGTCRPATFEQEEEADEVEGEREGLVIGLLEETLAEADKPRRRRRRRKKKSETPATAGAPAREAPPSAPAPHPARRTPEQGKGQPKSRQPQPRNRPEQQPRAQSRPRGEKRPPERPAPTPPTPAAGTDRRRHRPRRKSPQRAAAPEGQAQNR